ncbi:MAG TPA: DUF3107 domain-containing protein [Actinomycetales bacterium]|nr:DUF3107 domain-containing protein [Actinomycetales bacterium]
MEVRIGVQNVAREIIMESKQTPDEVAAAVDAALGGGSSLQLKDDKGRLIVVPVQALAYIEIGEEESRRVGFGAA